MACDVLIVYNHGMGNSESSAINPEQKTQLIHAIEDSSDKVFYSKYRKDVLTELNSQLESLKSQVTHNKIDHSSASQTLAEIDAKIKIIREIEDLQAKLLPEPKRSPETHTNPDAQNAWFDKHMQWEAEHRAIIDKITKLEKQLSGGGNIWAVIKKGLGF